MKNTKVTIISLMLLILYIFLVSNNNNTNVVIENATIPSLSIVDTKFISNELYYIIDTMTYNFKQGTTFKKVTPSVTSITPGEARHYSNLVSKGTLFPGMQKVLLLGQPMCENGLNSFINMIFATRTYSDTSQCAVLNVSGNTFLQTSLSGDEDLADFTEGILKNAHYDNFFSNKYKLMDIYINLYNKGHSLVIPYINIENSQPVIGGMAVFKKDKLIKLLNLNDSKLMNMLRESNVHGNLFLKDDNYEMVDCFINSNTKVYCTKEDDKYNFTIKLSLKGDVTTNTIYKNLSNDKNSIDLLQKRLEDKLTSKCNNFLYEMQNVYKLDCLNLGKHIIAIEGLNSNIDCDELVCNSKINLIIDLTIETFGRGDF